MSAYADVKSAREEYPDLKGDALRRVLLDIFAPPAKNQLLWINRFAGVLRAPRDPAKADARGTNSDTKSNVVLALKYRAWPVVGADLSVLEGWFAAARRFWTSAAKQVQNAARNYRSALDALKDAKDAKKDISAEGEAVERAKSVLNGLCFSGACEVYFDYLCPDVPIDLKRDVLKRFGRACGAGKASGKGLPTPTSGEKATLSIAFNGAGRWNELPPRYARASDPYSPPNHHGPRRGKYRSQRVMRKVAARINAKSPWFEFDVLFHRELIGCPKDIRISKERDQWYVIFGVERPLPRSMIARSYAALDLRWRSRVGGLSVAHIGTEDDFRSFDYDLRPNRRATRQHKDKTDLPMFLATPEGRETYQRAMDARKDAIKAKFTLHHKARWPSIRRIAEDADDPRSADCAVAVEWYDRAMYRYRHMCRVETNNKDRLDHGIARQIVAWCQARGITDVAIPNDGIKEIAEDDYDERLPRQMEDAAARNRHNSAPGRRRAVIEFQLRKAGIRTHRINPWKSSQRCPDCGHDTRTIEEEFKCEWCGRLWDNFVVACINGTRIVRECAGGDDHPHVCSRDGKDNPYHGFAGCDEAVEIIRAQKKARARAKKDKSKGKKGLNERRSQDEKVR